ncbi:unnamed protein product [Clonostachys rosea f. rosea IK726]|uniref:Uncharacterized protein n=2 Tax=Bionectria ochroleuca TaxID=29856 RepID=A0A0B7K9E0_BIOOC|nr:unnamed protein product [Clonostachys rosea f. rosea IK726]
MSSLIRKFKKSISRSNNSKGNNSNDNDEQASKGQQPFKKPLYEPKYTYRSPQLLALLPPRVLQRIFSFVCPHSLDESYETCESSAVNSACMLCDLLRLSHCLLVCKSWRKAGVPVLYHSIRIDPVHYCDREAELAEKRKKSRFDRNAIPEDPAQARLRLLRRTVRDDPTRLGKLVRYLKIPYMIRESCHVELAQTIAVLPNLHYVDLPEGMFSDEPSYTTLRLEVQARCPGIRKMTYSRGSERSLAELSTGRIWTQLEVLELDNIRIDPITLRNVLSSLSNLRAFQVSRTDSLTDQVLICEDGMPSLPPLEKLVLRDIPHVTVTGIISYLAWQETQQALKVLELLNTGVHPSSTQEILLRGTRLRSLSLQTQISEPFPNGAGIRPLASKTLDTLHFEISGPSRTGPYSDLESGYYSYLASSILGGGLPRLRKLYVLDETMPIQLQGLTPPGAAFASNRARSRSFTASTSGPLLPSLKIPEAPSGHSLSPPQAHRRPLSNITPPSPNRLSSNNPFATGNPRYAPPPTHTLEVFTKSDELGSWNFSRVNSSAYMDFGHGDTGRPGSSYGLGAELSRGAWDASEARRSVMVGNGTGAFLAVPTKQENPFGGSDSRFSGSTDSWRPKSSGGDSFASNRDLWR